MFINLKYRKMKASRVFAIIFNKAKKLDLNKELTEVIEYILFN